MSDTDKNTKQPRYLTMVRKTDSGETYTCGIIDLEEVVMMWMDDSWFVKVSFKGNSATQTFANASVARTIMDAYESYTKSKKETE